LTMVLCVKAKLTEAEQVKRHCQEHGLLLDGHRYAKGPDYLLFPVAKRFKAPYDLSFEERELEAVAKKNRLKDRLRKHLSPAELERLKSSFDVVGSIAILEVDEKLREKEGLLADTILNTHSNIKTVLKKSGGHEGELRLQRMALLAGEDTRETIVQENGVRLKINVEDVYYSVRSATERKRIASLVRPGERVLVMFSGAAPYCCVIAKNTAAAEVVGIELNEKGHEFGLENVRLNKLKNVVLIQGDVKEVVPALAEKDISFDRIVMPLPHTGHDFLDEAFLVAHEGTVIHLYDFEKEGEFAKAAEKAEAGAKKNGRKIKIIGITPSGQYSPRVFRVCVDFEVLD
jgi:tRNA (guanine37-N1)-methyltransferase